MKSELRRGRHVVFQMHVHLVFVPKYRKPVFDTDALRYLRDYFSSVCMNFEAQLIEFNGEVDHVHLLITYPPKVAVARLVNSLKGVSSRRLRQDRPDIAKKCGNNGLWSPSYFATTVGGGPLSTLRMYIRQQQTPRA